MIRITTRQLQPETGFRVLEDGLWGLSAVNVPAPGVCPAGGAMAGLTVAAVSFSAQNGHIAASALIFSAQNGQIFSSFCIIIHDTFLDDWLLFLLLHRF